MKESICIKDKLNEKDDYIEISNKHEIMNEKSEFFSIIAEITSHSTVQEMRKFRQHCHTSCYTHCLHVAYYSYIIAKKLGLDYQSTARAAMVHDLFLYDWRLKFEDPQVYGLHGFTHPKIALRNASEIFDLNEKEKDIIVKHMWPLTVALPKYKESYIVMLMDKYSAIREMYSYWFGKLKRKAFYRYAYIFLSVYLMGI